MRALWGLAASMPLLLIAGTLYAFGIYSPAFKVPKEEGGLGYSQAQLGVLSLSLNLGCYISFAPAALYGLGGVRLAFAYGGVLLAIGYGSLYAVLHGSLHLPLPAVAVLIKE